MSEDDNPPIQGDVLTRTVDFLVQEHHTFKDYLSDGWGTYAAKMADRIGAYYYLVAKGSDIMAGGIVSFQDRLCNVASKQGVPIVMAWSAVGSEKILFYMFNPNDVVDKTKWNNVRGGSDMRNFELNLGREYDPHTSIVDLWKTIRGKQEKLV